ncbi:MAG TPA: response regulator [Bacteroidia bacterium]
MKAIIIDDEPLARNLIREYLQSFPEINIIAECGDGFDAAKRIQSEQPDLIFLDVQMPKISGFEMLEILDELPKIIFTTAFDEYALKAFEANAVDYLLKPFSKDRFSKAVVKAIEEHKNNMEIEGLKRSLDGLQNEHLDKIIIKENGDVKIIPINDIEYFESYDDYVKIHTPSKVYVKKQTMAYYENNLKKFGFVRIHRSFLLNSAHLQSISSTQDAQLANLKNGAALNISRAGYALLKELLKL